MSAEEKTEALNTALDSLVKLHRFLSEKNYMDKDEAIFRAKEGMKSLVAILLDES
jgi:hypothetical protein